MRLTSVALVLISSLSFAQEKPDTILLNTDTMKRGAIGHFSIEPKFGAEIVCDRILSTQAMMATVTFANSAQKRVSMRVLVKTPTDGYVDGKRLPKELESGLWEVIGTTEVGFGTYFVVTAFKPKPVVKLPAIVLPFEEPALPKDDGRPLIVRQYSQAKKFRQDYSDIANSAKTPKERTDDYANASTQWATEAKALLKKVIAEKDAKIKVEKERIQAEAERMFPVAVGAKLAERAKVDTKRTEYFKEKFPPVLKKIQDDYSHD